MRTNLTIEGQRLEDALQYGRTAGYQSLVDWLVGLQENAHGRKAGKDWSLSVGSGSQDLIYKVRSSPWLAGKRL